MLKQQRIHDQKLSFPPPQSRYILINASSVTSLISQTSGNGVPSSQHKASDSLGIVGDIRSPGEE